MKLKECKYGILVFHKNYGVGMIVGITNNSPYADMATRSKVENAVTEVQWSSGRKHGIHPGNIEIYKGQS